MRDHLYWDQGKRVYLRVSGSSGEKVQVDGGGDISDLIRGVYSQIIEKGYRIAGIRSMDLWDDNRYRVVFDVVKDE